MKATLKDRVIAESDDIVESGSYHYFPPQSVHLEWLEKVRKTDHDKDWKVAVNGMVSGDIITVKDIKLQ